MLYGLLYLIGLKSHIKGISIVRTTMSSNPPISENLQVVTQPS